MPKNVGDKGKGPSRKINVDIAPGNRRRLKAYLRSFNEDPDRRHPAKTLTDVLNEALDSYFLTVPGHPTIDKNLEDVADKKQLDKRRDKKES